jgi:hypothetical protein
MNSLVSIPRGRLGLFTAPLAVAGLGLLVFAVLVAMGAAIEAPTVALAIVGVCLVFAIWRMFAVVHALAVPADSGLELRRSGGARRASIEDEFQRLLRSIKELEFDHDMGKISAGDFEEIEGNYRARAVEVMRQLEAVEDMHPDLERLLAVRERERSGALVEVDASSSEPQTPAPRSCAACSGLNDLDAKFCKHCGKELAA